MTLHHAHSRQHGFSILEVLIAVLVFSIGMIGLAGLLIFAIQSNHVAYLRTQATFLAHNMANRMGANSAGVWSNDYNGDYPAPGATVAAAGCDTGCTPVQLADYDKKVWSTQLTTFLPNAQGNITCTDASLAIKPSASQINLRPPYGGRCTMKLSWNEARVQNGSQALHTFEWVFQP